MHNYEINLNNTEKKATLLDIALVFACFMPWLSFGLNDYDSQPWPLIVALIYIFIRGNLFINKKFIYLLFLNLFIYLTFTNADNFFLFFRAIAGYATITITAYAFYLLVKSNRNIFKTLATINLIWILVGLIQLFSDPYIFDFLVSVRTSESRGMTSLAPEPTFYGLFLIYISWILLRLAQSHREIVQTKHLIALNVVAIIVIAKSAMATLYLIFIALAWIVFSKTKKSTKLITSTSILLSLGILYYFLLDTMVDSRLVKILEAVLESPELLITTDASANQRLSHIYYSLSGFIDNFMVPHGLAGLTHYAEQNDKLSDIFYSIPGEKIMSWSGSILFESGIFGLIMLAIILTMIQSRNPIGSNAFTVTIFLFLSLSAIPLGFTPLAALIGVYAAQQHIERYREVSN